MIWTLLENAVWAALLAASVLTVASLLDAMAHRGRLSRAARRARHELADAVHFIPDRGDSSAERTRHALRHFEHPLAQFYSWALNPDGNGAPELKAAGLLEETEGGRIRTAQFLARLSPLLGLGGTVVGLIQQFVFAAERGNQTLSMGAFGYCLFTTLAGIGIAAVALITSALLLEPVLRRVQNDLTNAVLVAQGHPHENTQHEGRQETCSASSPA